jgi:hypothetical protein
VVVVPVLFLVLLTLAVAVVVDDKVQDQEVVVQA